MSVQELLAQLNDITAPAQPGWWPLATGWWMVIGLLLFILITLWFIKKRRASHYWFVMAQQELMTLKQAHVIDNDASRLARELSVWLKRVALFAYPEKELAGLTGHRWLEFLDQSAGMDQFANGAGSVLADAVYKPDAQIDATSLLSLCEQWLDNIKGRLAEQEVS